MLLLIFSVYGFLSEINEDVCTYVHGGPKK